jgi:Tfp pilus assembly protein PilF
MNFKGCSANSAVQSNRRRAMQVITQLPRWLNRGTRSGCAVLAVLGSVLAGCASGGKLHPEPAKAVPPTAAVAPAVSSGPVVAPLADGRDGFSIREMPGTDAEARKDFERAAALMQNADYAKAAGLLEGVIERSPGVTAPYVNLAIAYRHMGKPEPAEAHLKTALTLVPSHPLASNEYGLLLRKAGRFAEARAIYEKTLASFPAYYPARKNLGILCDLYLNDQACALEQYEKYSEAKPADEKAKIWIAELKARMGQQ